MSKKYQDEHYCKKNYLIKFLMQIYSILSLTDLSLFIQKMSGMLLPYHILQEQRVTLKELLPIIEALISMHYLILSPGKCLFFQDIFGRFPFFIVMDGVFHGP